MTTLPTEHKTYVHHIALDPTGSLLASCSSDKTVEVFHRRAGPDGSDVWESGCVLRDHSGPVIRMAWCQHREHGHLLATAGADRWIYVNRITVSSHKGRTLLHPMRWPPVRGYEKDAIADVSFVPPQQYHVLLLSTASLDGCVRLYEVYQPQQFPCICKLNPEQDTVLDSKDGSAAAPESALLRSGGVTAIAWFPGSAECTMTLALGTVSGRFFLYRFIKESNTFSPIAVPQAASGELRCTAPVSDVQWAPCVGRHFQLLAICSRREVFILRYNCISPSLDEKRSFALFKYQGGAVSASWSRSATLLYLVTDDRATQVVVLQMRDPLDHSSWVSVSNSYG